jgi:hypothetical protein
MAMGMDLSPTACMTMDWTEANESSATAISAAA